MHIQIQTTDSRPILSFSPTELLALCPTNAPDNAIALLTDGDGHLYPFSLGWLRVCMQCER